jgi:hypothetical protein
VSQQGLTIIDDQESSLGNFLGQTAATSQAIQLAAAVLDKRIATARSFPRSVARFKKEAIGLLQEDLETAASAEYAKPVGNGTVKGASVRLAELAAMCWGNLEIEVSEPIIGEKNVTVMAKAWDLERNYSAPGLATTSILTKNGHRYAPHMVETAALATASKARRNAILAVIPKSYITDLLNAAKEVTSKNQPTLEKRRSDLIEFFARSYKVQREQIFEFLGVAGIDDITTEHLDEMRAVATAIKEGEPVEAFFTTKAASKADAVKEKIAERKAKSAAPATTKPEPAATVPPPSAKLEPPKDETPNGSQTAPPPAPPPAPEPDAEAKPATTELTGLQKLIRTARAELADVEYASDFARLVAALDADLATHDPGHKSGDLAAVVRKLAGVKDRSDLAGLDDKQLAKAVNAVRNHLDTIGSDLFGGAGNDGAAKSADALKH